MSIAHTGQQRGHEARARRAHTPCTGSPSPWTPIGSIHPGLTARAPGSSNKDSRRQTLRHRSIHRTSVPHSRVPSRSSHASRRKSTGEGPARARAEREKSQASRGDPPHSTVGRPHNLCWSGHHQFGLNIVPAVLFRLGGRAWGASPPPPRAATASGSTRSSSGPSQPSSP